MLPMHNTYYPNVSRYFCLLCLKKKKFPDNAKNSDENHKCMRKKLRHPRVSFTRTCLPDTCGWCSTKEKDSKLGENYRVC